MSAYEVQLLGTFVGSIVSSVVFGALFAWFLRLIIRRVDKSTSYRWGSLIASVIVGVSWLERSTGTVIDYFYAALLCITGASVGYFLLMKLVMPNK
jgi:hypothetical protein